MATRLSLGKSLLILFALLVAYLAWDIAKTFYWKSRVTAMCLEDGGNTVFEKVVVPKDVFERFSIYGSFIVPWDADKGFEEHPYKYRWEPEVIRSGSPAISRSVGVIYRVSDSKELGMHISYNMHSASMFSFLSAFSFSCSSMPGFNDGPNSTELIFSKGE